MNEPGISHLILEVTEDDDPFLIAEGSDAFGEIKEWESSGGQDLINPLYGGKFNFGGEGEATYTLVTDRSPVYGVFWAKGGQLTDWSAALNYEEYRTIETLTTTEYIVRPDGFTPVPEPATMLLLGAGLVGISSIGMRRRFKK